MERYTEKHYDGNGYYLICSGNCETFNCGDCGILDKIVDRLAAYEDTGLEPEEVNVIAGLASENCAKVADKIDQLLSDDKELEQYRALGPIDRLRELAGRTVRDGAWCYHSNLRDGFMCAVHASPNRHKPIMQAPSMFCRIWKKGVYLGIPPRKPRPHYGGSRTKKEEAQNDILRWCEFLPGGNKCLFRSKREWEYCH